MLSLIRAIQGDECPPRKQMAHGTLQRKLPLSHLPGGGQCFRVAAARKQEPRPIALVASPQSIVGAEREKFSQELLCLPDLTFELVRFRHKVKIVNTMPIIASRDFFRFVVAELQGVRFSELDDGLIAPSESAQVVAIHVLGMRD